MTPANINPRIVIDRNGKATLTNTNPKLEPHNGYYSLITSSTECDQNWYSSHKEALRSANSYGHYEEINSGEPIGIQFKINKMHIITLDYNDGRRKQYLQDKNNPKNLTAI